jgi:MarR family multiple gene transcriptional regulator MgrA
MTNIEKLITIKNFSSEQHKLMVSLIFVGNWIISTNQQFFKEYDITMQQFNILRILRGQHPEAANINMLKERMLDKMSDVSRLVERLRRAELVERRSSILDRRSVDVLITDSGLDLLHRIDMRMPELENLIRKTLNEEETLQLNNLLDKMLGGYE